MSYILGRIKKGNSLSKTRQYGRLHCSGTHDVECVHTRVPFTASGKHLCGSDISYTIEFILEVEERWGLDRGFSSLARVTCSRNIPVLEEAVLCSAGSLRHPRSLHTRSQLHSHSFSGDNQKCLQIRVTGEGSKISLADNRCSRQMDVGLVAASVALEPGERLSI